eukprot:TRINITY_DN19206_c0_g1_i1.p1 TRINITY_DN19206_c0_g1~~TRINITY_DN19206_c0_g1_i1.p1  ORF type:complete len:485 (+),score=140.92 TRINITY_DN19206_c0_g1_i1:1091-2545(+)
MGADDQVGKAVRVEIGTHKFSEVAASGSCVDQNAFVLSMDDVKEGILTIGIILNHFPCRVGDLFNTTWKVVEDDPYGQYPFLYVIHGQDKCILIDTGTGRSNFREFVSANLNPDSLPYLVICTHVHFDHVGCNYLFSGENATDVIDICMGERDTKFTNNYGITSLCMAHNCVTKDFTVTKWLQEGDLIYFDDANPSKRNSLEVLFTPGHTSDSISLYDHRDIRLFVGDTFYPYTAIHLDCIGSSVPDFLETLDKIESFCASVPSIEYDDDEEPEEEEEEKEPEVEDVTLDDEEPVVETKQEEQKPEKEEHEEQQQENVESSNTVQATIETSNEPPADQGMIQMQESSIDEFCNMLMLNKQEVKSQFDIAKLMEVNDWQVSAAVEFYFDNMSAVPSMFPPSSQSSGGGQNANTGSTYTKQDMEHDGLLKISCGHVEANLGLDCIGKVRELVLSAQAGISYPQHVEDGYGEFSTMEFTIMMPMPKN